jgi:hypothetical protein
VRVVLLLGEVLVVEGCCALRYPCSQAMQQRNQVLEIRCRMSGLNKGKQEADDEACTHKRCNESIGRASWHSPARAVADCKQ